MGKTRLIEIYELIRNYPGILCEILQYKVKLIFGIKKTCPKGKCKSRTLIFTKTVLSSAKTIRTHWKTNWKWKIRSELQKETLNEVETKKKTMTRTKHVDN